MMPGERNNQMATIADKYTDNIVGAFYVDTECICCHICSETAPDHFRESDEGGHHIVYRQPVNQAEMELGPGSTQRMPGGGDWQ